MDLIRDIHPTETEVVDERCGRGFAKTYVWPASPTTIKRCFFGFIGFCGSHWFYWIVDDLLI